MICRLILGLSQTFGEATAPRLAQDMDHARPSMIFSNYREIVTPEEAERYFNLFPPAQAENVVPMAQRA